METTGLLQHSEPLQEHFEDRGFGLQDPLVCCEVHVHHLLRRDLREQEPGHFCLELKVSGP